MVQRLVFATVVICLAGCAGTDPQGMDGPGPAASEEQQPVVLRGDEPFSWVAGAGAPGGTGQSAAADDVARLNLPLDTARLNLTIRWTCGTPAPACDLQVMVCEPKNAANARAPCTVKASGASPLAIDVTGPAPGEWTFTMRPVGADAEVSGVLHSEIRPKATPRT